MRGGGGPHVESGTRRGALDDGADGDAPRRGDGHPLAYLAVHFHELWGADRAFATLRERAGGQFDPTLAHLVVDRARDVRAIFEMPAVWQAAIDAEPGPRDVLEGERLDAAIGSCGDLADLKSHSTAGHARGVAALAEAAAAGIGLPADQLRTIRWAARLHDVGSVGVPLRVWEKTSPLTRGDWERVRLHPYHTDRVLSFAPSLRAVARIAELHHERMDGSGYHRRARSSDLQLMARVVAAADVFHALTEPRVHRPGRTASDAAAEVRRQARAGLLCADAAKAVIAASGQRARRVRREGPRGLSDREVDVLRLLARGATTKEVAARLGISAKTADHHVQHIYTKLGVSTRAAATLFAMRNGLVDDA